MGERRLQVVVPAVLHEDGRSREAIQHMIIRKNFGATHFIVGWDMAGMKSTVTAPAAHSKWERSTCPSSTCAWQEREHGVLKCRYLDVMVASLLLHCRRSRLRTVAVLQWTVLASCAFQEEVPRPCDGTTLKCRRDAFVLSLLSNPHKGRLRVVRSKGSSRDPCLSC